ncbi:hypothetical protein ACFQFQ_14475 [Sulfitobacter porphyrae]|uniref:Uncharacterized protein n=1 Tax=Sulfitobacter porphyrae TaxID=1246864 RepID=A0ABW2B6G0_9RHOB|nr:hypothetical protein GCM10007928_01970 [Sulfitobacter porphyrae]
MPDPDLIKEARRLGCNDELVITLTDRLEEMRGALMAIRRNPSLAACQGIANRILEQGSNNLPERLRPFDGDYGGE